MLTDLDSIPRTKQIWSCLHLLLKSVYDFDELKTKHTRKEQDKHLKLKMPSGGFSVLKSLMWVPQEPKGDMEVGG